MKTVIVILYFESMEAEVKYDTNNRNELDKYNVWVV